MTPRPPLLVGAVAAVAALASGCGSQAPADVPSEKVTVVLLDESYEPAHVTIGVGDRVTFVNRSKSPNTAETADVGFFEHDRTALARRNQFDLHTFVRGEAESVAFDTPGTYRYRSSFDETMTGVIEVVKDE